MQVNEQVIYDVHHLNSRYMSVADMQQEAWLLGLKPSDTVGDLAKELHRRGLDDFSLGRAVRGASA